ncbi:MAG: hypothetical protein ACE14M_01150 [Terriglobales bacterium]
MEFAKEIGVDPSTMSRIENGHQSAGGYAVSANDDVLLRDLALEVDRLLQDWVGSPVPKKIVKSVKDNEWSEAKAA